MNSRAIQLGNKLCDQDRLILDLFGCRPVKYIGIDKDFCKNLNINQNSKSIIAIFNQPNWLSEFLKFIKTSIQDSEEFYIGVNRYLLLGNDTTHQFDNGSGTVLLQMIKDIASNMGYTILKSGSMDNDQGRYFNFVQPLTWAYGTNQSNR